MNDKLDVRIRELLQDYLARNTAARTLARVLDDAGVGFMPVVDHLTLRTFDIDRRAAEFVALGYRECETLNYDDWFAKVYRLTGYPAFFIDQAYADSRGASSIIPGWVEQFGDQTLHHVAVRVADIEHAVAQLSSRGVSFAGNIVGEQGSDLRQIFTIAELVDGKPFSVMELIERQRGFQGFSPPNADSLMRSSTTRL
jgi:catechol 2,3-dioxygenase-like lactoylglutathione lyase family enzyme